jgi:hypothetical protein
MNMHPSFAIPQARDHAPRAVAREAARRLSAKGGSQ